MTFTGQVLGRPESRLFHVKARTKVAQLLVNGVLHHMLSSAGDWVVEPGCAAQRCLGQQLGNLLAETQLGFEDLHLRRQGVAGGYHADGPTIFNYRHMAEATLVHYV